MMQYLETEHGIFTSNEVTGQTAEQVYAEYLINKDKQIDICPTKTNKELQEEITTLKEELDQVKERLTMQQEMSSIAMEHIYGNEVAKND